MTGAFAKTEPIGAFKNAAVPQNGRRYNEQHQGGSLDQVPALFFCTEIPFCAITAFGAAGVWRSAAAYSARGGRPVALRLPDSTASSDWIECSVYSYAKIQPGT